MLAMEKRRTLSVDIGSQNTRAWLFEQREEGYALVCSAVAETSAASGQDLRGGVNRALEALQEKSGLRLLDLQQKLIRAEEGVGACGLSLSAGKPIRTVLAGISDTYSLAALQGCHRTIRVHPQDRPIIRPVANRRADAGIRHAPFPGAWAAGQRGHQRGSPDRQ
jgi:hypothetical protein